MRRTISTKPSSAVTLLCAACRRRATRSFPSSTTATTTATTAVPATTALRIPSTRRFLSQAPPPPRDSSPATGEPPTPDPTTTATSSLSGGPRPSPPSYYALFPMTLAWGPPPDGPFHIDVRALRREFLRLQAAAHPDFHAHAGADAGARRQAEAASSLINEAFRTLADPLSRARYLLRERFGVDLAGDEAGDLAEAEEGVLSEVLEARERIEEAESEEDLVELREENEARIRRSEEEIGRLFESGDVEGLKREVVRLRYWVSIREGIDGWEKGKGVVLEH